MKITNTNINLLNVCIRQILATSDKISGGIIFNLNRNAGLLKTPLEELDKTRNKIVDQYVDKDKDGIQKYKKQTAEEKKDKVPSLLSFTTKNEELADSELKEVFETELDIEFIKLPLSKFETLSLDTKKIPGLNVFIDCIIDEAN